VLNKPSGITSQTAVTAARKAFGVRKIGHCGTLDPMAEGVLPLMIGNATKACDLLMDHEKTYVATFRPGVETDTEDVTGTVLRTCEGPLPSFLEFREAAESFRGQIEQVPPMYSALKNDGQKLVDLARKGVEVERKPRTVQISDISASEDPETGAWTLSVRCSRGTYIRTLCADIGRKLGCGGCMASLLRTSVGSFRLEDSLTLDQMKEMAPEELEKKLIPLSDVFSAFPAVFLPPFQEKLYANGERILLSRLPRELTCSWKEGDRLRIYLKSRPEDLHSLADVRPSENGPELVSAVRFF
ncbi:MAG: tRNA pseudouridine(55) synthase TruB, partial [Clostridia bacterium]|nr:tRNA pseudouridine(55) synthase TruB [Clostridia bacterium]